VIVSPFAGNSAFSTRRRALAERGRVKWFNENRGYGFIRRENGGNEVYVHYSDIAGEGFRTLSEGEEVEFDLSVGERGPEAKNVRKSE
jgi:CspA family cold shock protein